MRHLPGTPRRRKSLSREPVSRTPAPASSSRGPGARRALRLLALLLTTGALTAGTLTAGTGSAAARPAAAPAPAVPAPAGPPTEGRFTIQSVGGGYQISGSELLLRTSRPKGDEDNQQWYFEASGAGTHKIRNPTRDDRCAARDSNAEGAARLAFRDCAATATDWQIQRVAGERYRILVPGGAEILRSAHEGGEVTFDTTVPAKPTVAEDVAFAKPHQPGLQGARDAWDSYRHTLWYITPVDPARGAMPADPTFDQRTHLTTHNAFYNQDDANGAAPFPAQPNSIATQLRNGVRGLMLDAYQFNGRVRMCHGACLPTSQPMSDVVVDIANFLRAEEYRNEIVTVFVEDYTEPGELAAEVGDDLGAAGVLNGLVFEPNSALWNVRSQGWPKVSRMVAENKRLVLFSSKDDKESLGFMNQSDWTAENYWSMGAGIGNSDWSCYSRWGDVPLAKEEGKFRRLFVMNHFRDAAGDITSGGDNQKALNRAQRFCSTAARKKPNFLAIDRYQTGNPMSAVDALNEYTYHGDTPGYGGTRAEQGDDWSVPRLTVMPLGDSITEGAGSSTRSSYRAALWPRLTGRTTALDFVGSQRHGQLPDTDHEGHSGWLIDGLSANIDGWLAAARPNVVLLHIGTNDMDRNHQVATAPARLAGLIDQIVAASPATTVLVASLVPSTSPAVQARVTAYNAQIPGIVAERRAVGHKVEHVDMSAVTTADLRDRLHPNDAGYVKMADAFFGGVSRVARDGWISEQVDVRPAVPRTGLGDYQVDLNADRRADYLVVEASGAVRAWLNKGGDGRGGWTAAGQVASGVGAPGASVRFADLNGDGYADYLVVDANGAVRAWLNKGGTGIAGWTAAGQVASGTGASADQVRFADLNADGYADYVTVDTRGAVQAWLNNGGTGTTGWTEAGQIASGVGVPADQVRFADANADGYADYLAVDTNGAVRAWINKGGTGLTGWTATGQIASGANAPGSSVRFADLDADRRADYLVVEPTGAIRAWLNNGGDGTGVGGGWTPAGTVAPATGVTGSQVRFADVDADRRDDYLVVAADGSVRAWLNNGTGGWTPAGQITGGVGAPGDQVRFADLNADGRADYLVVEPTGVTRAWLHNGGDGHGGWTPLGIYASGTGAPADQVRFADTNADGRADYLVVAADGSVRVWLNNGGDGNGGWGTGTAFASGTGAAGDQVRLSDVNADGRADYLAVAANGAVRAWLNKGGNGNGGWTPQGAYAPSAGAPGSQVLFAEVNGDGRADYLVVAADGSVRVRLNNGGELTGGWASLGTIASGAGAPANQVRI
ncbi:FG-GAP-like repeat-containing protein [Streptomyces sp. NPDC001985]|uniref:FG-GAP-like repeat-containing protein n=1 Tax=Streptomyces sp. NPDC001985 TaxID=3154406 RepID=UPI00332EB3B4